MELTKKKLSRATTFTYGFGDGGFQFMVNMELMYFALFLTDYCKFAPAIAGLILTITSIVDVVWVPTAGAIVEKANFKWMKWGKYRSWLLVGPPITYLLFIPMFLFIPGTIAPYIIAFGFVASHLIWNIVYTAHLSLINVMTDDPYERTKLSTSRQICSTVAKVIFGYVVLTSIKAMGTAVGNPPVGFTLGAMIWPLLMIVGYYVVFATTKGHDVLPPILSGAEEKKKEKVPLSLLLKETFKNGQVMVLICADFFRCLAYYLLTGTAIYFFNKIFGSAANWPIYLVIINITAFLGTLIAAPLAKRIGKKATYITGVFAYAVLLIVVYLFASTDIFFIVSLALGTMLLQFAFCMITAMFADTVTYGEWKNGKNIRGFVMGLLSMPIKLSIFARSAIIGGILAAIAYVPNVPATSLEIGGIKTLVAVIPAAACVISGILMLLFYKLTDKKMVQYASDINERKAKASA